MKISRFVVAASAGIGLALSFTTGSAAVAAGLLAPVSDTEARVAAGKGSVGGAHVLRSRIVKVDTAELARHVAPLGGGAAADRITKANALDGVIGVDLFPNVSATFTRTDVDDVAGSLAWVGETKAGSSEFVSMIVDNGQVTGFVQLGSRTFRIEPLDGAIHRVLEIDASKLPEDRVKEIPASKISTMGAPSALDQARAGTNTIIRVLIAYTKAAKVEDANIVNDIKNAVSIANAGYKNTNMLIKLQVADIISAGNYNEATGGDDFEKNLNDVDGSNGSVLKAIRTKRNKLKADVVSLWRKTNSQGLCGIANLTDHPKATNTSNFAFSVMNWQCISNLSFHHEIGHNMGLRHDRFVDNTPGVGYNHGYVNDNQLCKVRTIMAYNNACSNQGFNCTRVNVFSTPKFVWILPNQTRCVIGVANSTDNSRRGKETKGQISKYRTGTPADMGDEVAAAADK